MTIGGTSGSPVTQSATYYGIIAGSALSLAKNGGGNQTFVGTSTYGGSTTINGGAIIAANGLSATASATGSGAVTVANGGTLGTASGPNGSIAGLVTVQNGGQLAPTVVGTGTSTLELNGGLTLNNGSILSYNLGAANSGTNPLASPASDNVWLNAGTLSLAASSTDTLNITSLSGFGPGIYSLIETTGTIPSSLTGITFNVNGPLKYLYTVSLAPASGTASASNPNALDLNVVTNPNPALTWVGAAGNGVWNTNPSNQPWTFTGGSGSAAYADGGISHSTARRAAPRRSASRRMWLPARWFSITTATRTIRSAARARSPA